MEKRKTISAIIIIAVIAVGLFGKKLFFNYNHIYMDGVYYSRTSEQVFVDTQGKGFSVKKLNKLKKMKLLSIEHVDDDILEEFGDFEDLNQLEFKKSKLSESVSKINSYDRLEKLYFYDSEVDLKDINIKTLKDVSFVNCKVKNISILKECPLLEKLSISGSTFDSYVSEENNSETPYNLILDDSSFLEGFNAVTELTAEDMQIADISGILKMSKLKKFIYGKGMISAELSDELTAHGIENYSITIVAVDVIEDGEVIDSDERGLSLDVKKDGTDLSKLGKYTDLEQLSIINADDNSLNELCKLDNLKELELKKSNVTVFLSKLDAYEKLEKITFYDSTVDLSVFKSKTLKEVAFDGCKVKNISALKECPALEKLSISRTAVDNSIIEECDDNYPDKCVLRNSLCFSGFDTVKNLEITNITIMDISEILKMSKLEEFVFSDGRMLNELGYELLDHGIKVSYIVSGSDEENVDDGISLSVDAKDAETKMSDLSRYNDLQKLSIANASDTSVNELGSFDELIRLEFTDSDLSTSLSKLNSYKKLSKITFTDSEVDLNAFSCGSVKEIVFERCSVKNAAALKDCPSLEKLRFSESTIDDCVTKINNEEAPLKFILKKSQMFADLDNVKHLELINMMVFDPSGILEMDKLEELVCSQGMLMEDDCSEMEKHCIKVLCY
ncbi:MAG: hypothetical protein GXY08_14735 [Ruminococcus sp.]|nr:hypothetical protein [Ruminococcus sp.]